MIDFHTHPVLVREMFKVNPDLERIARDVFYIRNNPQPLETFHLELDVAGIERAVILPIDCRTSRGCQIYSNQEIAKLCEMSGRFIGFASVDPHRPDAPRELAEAIQGLGLRGLKLAPSIQEFYANDRELAYPIYEAAQSLEIPLIVHAGMTWEPGAMAKYSHPLLMEDMAHDFPELKIVIAHFAWPWVMDAAMLALRYPNIYLDTSCLYFGNPTDFLRYVFTQQLSLDLVEKGLRTKVLFGSNYPRVEIKNMAKALKGVGLSQGTLKLIFDRNAKIVLGEERV